MKHQSQSHNIYTPRADSIHYSMYSCIFKCKYVVPRKICKMAAATTHQQSDVSDRLQSLIWMCQRVRLPADVYSNPNMLRMYIDCMPNPLLHQKQIVIGVLQGKHASVYAVLEACFVKCSKRMRRRNGINTHQGRMQNCLMVMFLLNQGIALWNGIVIICAIIRRVCNGTDF